MSGNQIIFGFGDRATKADDWLRLTRDLSVDLKKGLAAGSKGGARRFRRSSMRVAALWLLGEGQVANVSLAQEENLAMFLYAADWFVENQVLIPCMLLGSLLMTREPLKPSFDKIFPAPARQIRFF